MALSVFTACGNNDMAADEVDTTNENSGNTDTTTEDENQNADKNDKNNNDNKNNADNNASENEKMTMEILYPKVRRVSEQQIIKRTEQLLRMEVCLRIWVTESVQSEMALEML